MWRRWKAGQGKLCFVSCSHQRASAGKYLFPQTQQGLQFVQLSARTQNDGPRLLAQKLPERDNQPRIIDGPERVRNITSLFRCFTVMSDRSDHPSVPTYLRRPSCFSVRLERRFSVPACNLTERWSQRRSREARSRAEPRAAASLRRAWRARRALDLDGPLRPAQRLIRLGASELPLPLPTIPTARREAEAGSPSKSVTTTPSIAVILLTGAAALELNIYRIASGPSVTGGEAETDCVALLKAVRSRVRLPLAVKLHPYFSAFGALARQLDHAGADGLVLFNRLYQLDIDLVRLRWSNDVSLSGAAEIRLGLLWLSLLAGRLPRASLAAGTGVETADEVIKYLLAGADAVMTTSALLRHGPGHLRSLVTGLETWLSARGFTSVTAIKGLMRHKDSDAEVHERGDYIRSLLSYRGPHVHR